MTDPIADMIIRIKNALLAQHESVVVPHSKLKARVAQILVDYKYISELKVEEAGPQPNLVLKLRYVGRIPAITDVKRVSKPGRRVYSSSRLVPRALGGYGITIVSTSKGVMTDQDARKQNIGGEVLCQVW
jgi:small subunit ribosomal protein S8